MNWFKRKPKPEESCKESRVECAPEIPTWRYCSHAGCLREVHCHHEFDLGEFHRLPYWSILCWEHRQQREQDEYFFKKWLNEVLDERKEKQP